MFLLIIIGIAIIAIIIYLSINYNKKPTPTPSPTPLPSPTPSVTPLPTPSVTPSISDIHPILSKQQQTSDSKIIIAYLNALYPQSGNFESLVPSDVLKFYDNLMWYYLPIIRNINEKKRGPLTGPYKNASCQWFMADGTDCGDPSAYPGEFTCSVFGGSCSTWEFGNAKLQNGKVINIDGGRPYQYVSFIQPYGMRNGCPSNGYIECVAFACEQLGRMLLSPSCNSSAPDWDTFIKNQNRNLLVENYTSSYYQDLISNLPAHTHSNLLNNLSINSLFDTDEINSYTKPVSKCSFPTQTNSCDKPDKQNPGCQIGSSDQIDTCCWDYDKNKADDTVCPFPSKCMASQDVAGGPVYGNYCSVPCGYSGCDVTNGCDWTINGKSWVDALSSISVGGSNSAKFVKNNLQLKSLPSVNGSLPKPRNDKSVQKTMFYWCKGYGKFLNMGNTGVYFSYVHFLLTCPKFAKDGKTPIRWSYPQILQTATLDGGNSTMINQLLALIGNGSTKDTREYLEGYVTTLKGKEYEGINGEDISNKMVYNTENVGSLVNPLDDDNLKAVDKYTITRYYDPDKNIKNPQYNKVINNSPLNAIYLQQGMHIYGATSSSRKYPFVNLSHGGGIKDTLGHSGSGTWPFGVFFEGATLGGCVYKMIDMCGWKSAQFTQMPTGAGGTKYCNSPEFDFEIVYIADKNKVCSSEMKMLDPVIDLDNYINNGFIDGNKFTASKLNSITFDATKMSLTERNVPDSWKGDKPNKLLYDYFNNNKPVTTIPYTSVCPYKDNIFNK